MEELQSLVKLISKNKLKQVHIMNDGAASNLNILYEALSNGKFESEEEAADFFYQNNPNKLVYFNRLKRQLKDRLIDNLFLIDLNQPNYTSLPKALYSCQRNLAASKILIGRYQRSSAIPILKKTLNIALKFEFTEVVLEIARELRIHYGTLLGDKKKYHEYNQLVKKYCTIYSEELKAEEYYAEIAGNYSQSKSTKPEVIKTAKKYYAELRKISISINSYKLSFFSFLVFSLRYEIANDYLNTLKVSQEALNYFNSKKHIASKSAIFAFLLKSFTCYLQMKKYEQAEKAANQCLELMPEGSSNWFLTLDYYMILCFHSGQFQKAYSIYYQTIHHPDFKKQYQNISEHWLIHEAFIFYFLSIGKIHPNDNNQEKKFRVSKFLNEVPILSKDKRGTNINILILQILFLLQQGKYGEIIDKMEPLKTYTHRYLRKDHTFRSNCFIKMLLQLPQNSFHKAAVLRKADKYWKKLQSVPLDIANQSSEIEIVPYETLWQYVVESLEFRFH